jgi:uncharacterized protein (DUF1800 family)
MASLNPVSGTLNRSMAAHLLRRTTFGPTRASIDQFTGMPVAEAVNQLLTVPDPVTERPDVNFQENEEVIAWWLNKIVTSDVNILERMVYFYHTHFTTIQSRIRNANALYHQNELFRFYAKGNFKTLSTKMCRDNAMLRHLDGILNEVGRPNENFARELLELYTIGKGPQTGQGDYTTFTEIDVVEGSKVLSGYKEDFTLIDPDTGLPMARIAANRHDASAKTFSYRFQQTSIAPLEVIDGKATEAAVITELQSLIDMIFEQDATAEYICQRLYRYFCYYEITGEVQQDIVVPMAETLRSNGYELEPVLQQLFTSQHFFDQDNAIRTDDNKGAIIKSPLELTVHALRFFGITPPAAGEAQLEFYARTIYKPMELQGMNLYEPFEVAGYPAYHQTPFFNRAWISANYLARRYQYADLLLNGVENEGQLLAAINSLQFVEANINNPASAREVVQTFVDYMFPEIITDERFEYFLESLDELGPDNWRLNWENYKRNGDPSMVRAHLDMMLRAIMQSPEYQLF